LTILKDKHGVDLESLYKGKNPLPEMRLPDVQVIEAVPPPKYEYSQGVKEVPAKGLNILITWAIIMPFWCVTVRIHEMESNAARVVIQDGEMVNQTYKKRTRGAHRTTLKQVMELFYQKSDQGAIPTLRNAKAVMQRLARAN